jgi:hypothetical protein
MAGFHEAVDVCEFGDLGYIGNSWTFKKRVAGGSFCRVTRQSFSDGCME